MLAVKILAQYSGCQLVFDEIDWVSGGSRQNGRYYE
jgi:hypothetical protein